MKRFIFLPTGVGVLFLLATGCLLAQMGPGDIDGNSAGVPTLDDLQQTGITRVEEAAEVPLQELKTAQSKLTAATWARPADPAAIRAAAEAVAAAELKVALARADAFARIQAGSHRLSPSQVQEVVAFRVRGGPAGRGGRGFGAGRGGAAGAQRGGGAGN